MAETYYTYRIRIANRDRVRVEKRDPQNRVIGEPGGALGYGGARRKRIDELAQDARRALLGGTEVRAFGEELFNALFDDALRQDFVNLYNRAIHVENKLLRIELDVDERAMPEVAALPWEFMRVPTDADLGSVWLGTAPDLIFSRRRAQWHVPQPIQLGEDERLQIALAVAAPEDWSPVAYEEVWSDLEKLVGRQPDRIKLLPLVDPATPEAIDDVLAQDPHIFHFIGHGRLRDKGGVQVGQVALVDDWNEAMLVDEDYFSELLNRHRPGVVLLQSCEGGMLSASQAFVGVASRVVQQNIPVVVAMQYEVSNSTASRFARRFYQQLAQDQPVDRAAQDGRRRIALGPMRYKSRDFATPVIFMRVADGHLFQRRGVGSTDQGRSAEVSQPQVSSPVTPVPSLSGEFSLPQLARNISQYFSDVELRGLCFDLGIDYENLPGSGKGAKARELVMYCERRGLILSLRKRCHELRSHVDW